jgi:hypothetical protein
VKVDETAGAAPTPATAPVADAALVSAICRQGTVLIHRVGSIRDMIFELQDNDRQHWFVAAVTHVGQKSLSGIESKLDAVDADIHTEILAMAAQPPDLVTARAAIQRSKEKLDAVAKELYAYNDSTDHRVDNIVAGLKETVEVCIAIEAALAPAVAVEAGVIGTAGGVAGTAVSAGTKTALHVAADATESVQAVEWKKTLTKDFVEGGIGFVADVLIGLFTGGGLDHEQLKTMLEERAATNGLLAKLGAEGLEKQIKLFLLKELKQIPKHMIELSLKGLLASVGGDPEALGEPRQVAERVAADRFEEVVRSMLLDDVNDHVAETVKDAVIPD